MCDKLHVWLALYKAAAFCAPCAFSGEALILTLCTSFCLWIIVKCLISWLALYLEEDLVALFIRLNLLTPPRPPTPPPFAAYCCTWPELIDVNCAFFLSSLTPPRLRWRAIFNWRKFSHVSRARLCNLYILFPRGEWGEARVMIITVPFSFFMYL